ncbi:MAG: phosphate signaling complex protein PhoU [Gammaproteobacteria bacterium]|nr:phosphate signaling complex protein PhoU [Gammaproteobacteria bacterium]
MLKEHIFNRFDKEMSALHDIVMQMSELARSQMRDAVAALMSEDVEWAQAIIEKDKSINDLDKAGNEEIIRIIAKRQPVARDLRDIMVVNKVISDIERIGDLARWVARITLHFYEGDRPPPNHSLLEEIPRMATMVDEMLRDAVFSLQSLDVEKAVLVIQAAIHLESEFKAAIRRLSTYLMEDSRSIGHVTEIILGLRAIERAGGHAKNVAISAIFLIKGVNLRHESLEQIAADVGLPLHGKS